MLIFVSCFIVLTSCDTSTEVSKGDLTGNVQLEGETDHSGIVIALYELAYLDTTIVRINNQYPQIGVHINQHTEFDHRLQLPIKSTETLADGSFEITKIATGTYNLVAIKDGFGFKYLYEIEINEGENTLTPNPSPRGRGEVPLEKGESKGVYSNRLSELTFSVISTAMEKSNSQLPFPISHRTSDLTLYPELHISGNIQENITVLPDHHLIIDDNTDIVPGTSLTIHSGAVIRINPGVDLTIHGNLLAQGEENNMFWITSNDGFESSLLLTTYFPREELLLYNSMELSSIASVSDDLIEWGKWDYANTSLLNQVNNLHIQSGIFRNAEIGYKCEGTDFAIFENLLITMQVRRLGTS